ncbi:hypothetical protein [Neobacillus drentensis]|uniref:hypothetical protein n=1 Tax=Neobacillus drentensis TaxID=220684 RepID=UPI003001E0A1
MKANREIRMLIKQAGIHTWQVAEKLGIHENTLFRKLRKELNDEGKRLVFEVIDQIMAELRTDENLSQSIKYKR